MIFHHISRNLSVLREQLAFIEDEDIQAMYGAVYAKYIMFKYVVLVRMNHIYCFWESQLSLTCYIFQILKEISGSNADSSHGRTCGMYMLTCPFKVYLNSTQDIHYHIIFIQIYINVDDSSENYWLRLLVREWAQFCIFLYIGYILIA